MVKQFLTYNADEYIVMTDKDGELVLHPGLIDKHTVHANDKEDKVDAVLCSSNVSILLDYLKDNGYSLDNLYLARITSDVLSKDNYIYPKILVRQDEGISRCIPLVNLDIEKLQGEVIPLPARLDENVFEKYTKGDKEFTVIVTDKCIYTKGDNNLSSIDVNNKLIAEGVQLKLFNEKFNLQETIYIDTFDYWVTLPNKESINSSVLMYKAITSSNLFTLMLVNAFNAFIGMKDVPSITIDTSVNKVTMVPLMELTKYMVNTNDNSSFGYIDHIALHDTYVNLSSTEDFNRDTDARGFKLVTIGKCMYVQHTDTKYTVEDDGNYVNITYGTDKVTPYLDNEFIVHDITGYKELSYDELSNLLNNHVYMYHPIVRSHSAITNIDNKLVFADIGCFVHESNINFTETYNGTVSEMMYSTRYFKFYNMYTGFHHDESISSLYSNCSVLYNLLKECESHREVDKEYLLHRVKLGELKVYHNPVNDMAVFYNAV